jgi:formylglycine-generating enzyme required for sulfatase activity
MEQVKYQNFDVLIQHLEGEIYPTRVLHSPAGETRGQLSFSSLLPNVITNLKSLRDFVLEIRPEDESDLERWTQATRFGELLFDALMSGEVRSCFDVSLNLARRSEHGLRVRMRIEPPELSALPWELMHDKRSNSFISLSIHTPIVRYVELQQSAPPLTTRKPLRILVVISSPTDQPALSIDAETGHITQALSDLVAKGDVKITIMREANLLAIQKQLREDEYHVLHYIGHGHFGETDGEGYLVFETNQGRSHYVGGRKLGPLLHDEDTLRLVVLNACSTAVTAEAKPFSGVATALVQAGIPAVVAMQTSVTDQAALQFSQVFYESIADGCPIDTSVAEGRKAIDFSASHTVEWAIPELFMRVGDGRLFNFGLTASEPSPPETLRPGHQQPAKPTVANARNPEAVIEPTRSTVKSHSLDVRGTSPPQPQAMGTRGAASDAPRIDVRPVTNEDFMRFVEAGGKPPSTWQRGRCPREKAGLPVTGVSWHQAVAYAQWKGKRLPTASEWDNAIGGLERSGALWEWTADEVKPRGLGRKETKRALRGGPPNQSTDRPQTSAWPEEELDYIGFRCAQ